jgi:hypothetical protein
VAGFDYNKSKRTADRLIKQFGAPLEYTRQSGETYDPVTGTTTATTETFTADTVWLDFSKEEIDETSVQSGDARLLVSSSVKIDDRVVYNGNEWRIIDSSPLRPADVEVYTEAQARK